MYRSTLLSFICLALTACAAGGPNPDTPLRTIGPGVKKAGVFTGEEGAVSGTLNAKGFKAKSTDEKTTAPTSADTVASGQGQTGSVSVNAAEYAEFQAWKNAQQQKEFEAWKASEERKEFEAWKRSRENQQ